MRYKTEHKEQTRARLLREAASEIRAKGPSGVGVAGIMARAGLTHGGFYAHFPSKDALVEAAIGTMFDEAAAKFVKTTAEAEPRQALRDYVDFYLSQAHRDARERGCPLPALSGDLARADGSIRERFGEGAGSLLEGIEKLLRRLGHEAPRAAAASLVSEMVGAVTLARAVSSREQSDSLLESARASILARFDLGGRR